MNKKYLNIAKKYALELEKDNIDVQILYIFGSKAKGISHSDSDLDIGIVSNSFGNDKVKERVRLLKIRRKVSWLIEPHPFTPKSFQDKHNLLAQEVKRTGIKVI